MHCTTSPKPPRSPDAPLWLLTGASSGIGLAIAQALSAQGHTLIAWSRDAGRLERLRASAPGVLATQSLDLSRLDTLASAATALTQQWPQLQGLIHCAGIQHECLLDDPDYDCSAIEAELRTNLLAPIELTRALLPHLRRQAGARIVFVSSALAHAPKRRAAVYCASKSGLSAFADSLRAQLQGSAIEVLELIPPLVDTPMTAGRGRNKLPPEAVAQALLRALNRPRLPPRLWVGRARLLRVLLRLAPTTTRHLFLKPETPT